MVDLGVVALGTFAMQRVFARQLEAAVPGICEYGPYSLAYIDMAYVGMAYVVMALYSYGPT